MRPISALLPLRTMLTLLLVAAGSLTALAPALASPPEAVLHTFTGYLDGYYPTAGLIQGSDGNFYGTTYYGGLGAYGTVFKLTSSGFITTLHSFTGPDGIFPFAALIQGKDGYLYGTTNYGGANADGTVFKISTDGATFITLHSFDGTNGQNPYAALIQGKDGYLYGTTNYGGANADGTVFKLGTNGKTFTTLHSFDGSDGANPYGGVIQGSDGNLYGATNGGRVNGGTIFKVSTNGKTFTTLHSFNGTDGYQPYAGLIQGKDGNLYGTTEYGGANDVGNSSGDGTVFKISTDGATFTTLHSFGGKDGANPYGGVIQGSDGNLYGTASQGGANRDGTVFKLNTSGTAFKILHSFDGTNGQNPYAALIQGKDGYLYGTASRGGASNDGTVFEVSTDGTKFTLLYDLSSGFHDGLGPFGGLTLGSDGNFYGTTYAGGPHDVGTVFEISTDSTTYSILHNFDITDSAAPSAGLTQGKDGNFYGTTLYGGANGLGTVFKLSTNGKTFKVLYSFSQTDGSATGGVIQGKDGNLYGTTGSDSISQGTVFKLSTSGSAFTTLHRFSALMGKGTNTDGVDPAGLIQGSDGNLYGTTSQGGAKGGGTVFMMSTDGSTFTTLHSFNGFDGKNGYGPYGGVIQGSDGYFYGTTGGGGANSGGTVFKLSTDGETFKILHSFNGTDGDAPKSGVIQGSDGNLYGTTYQGGASNNGTVFEVSTDGTTFLTLHTFAGSPTDGQYPTGLIEGPDGNLHGTTGWGGILLEIGSNVEGTVFQLQTQLPFKPIIASFSPAKVKVGASVTVSGRNLAEATSVTINGVAQTISSDSANSLKFKVTTGTTTGTIVVTTPKGTGSSSTSLIID